LGPDPKLTRNSASTSTPTHPVAEDSETIVSRGESKMIKGGKWSWIRGIVPCIHPKPPEPQPYKPDFKDSNWAFSVYGARYGLVFDGVEYRAGISWSDIPAGFCEVDVKLIDNGETFNCVMVAGHIGATLSGENDAIGPSPHWFMLIKEEE
jgi:hypothetical protein